MYKAVIFDFDYTLGDSTPGIVQCANYALGRLGYPEAGVEAIRKTVGLTLPETFTQLTGVEDPAQARAYEDFFHEKAEPVVSDNTRLYPDVLPLLAALRERGCRTAVVTTKARRTIRRIAQSLGMAPLLDRIVGGDDVQKQKPDPEGLLGTIDAFGLTRAEALYVGDSLVDARTAQAAGVDFAALLTGTTPAPAFAPYRPLFTGQGLRELWGWILEG